MSIITNSQDDDEQEYPEYAILTRVDQITSFDYNENDTCSSWQASLSNNPIELQVNLVGLNFVLAEELGLPYDPIFEEAYSFINYYGYIVPKWKDPYQEYYYQYSTYEWTFLNAETYDYYWSPYGE